MRQIEKSLEVELGCMIYSESYDLSYCYCYCYCHYTSDAARSGASCRITCLKCFAFTSDLMKRGLKKMR
jgi:hypothetical protein